MITLNNQLDVAFELNNLPLIKRLIKLGASLSKNGLSFFYQHASHGDIEIVKFIYDNMQIKQSQVQLAIINNFSFSQHKNTAKLIELFLHDQEDIPSLFELSVQSGKLDILEQLLDKLPSAKINKDNLFLDSVAYKQLHIFKFLSNKFPVDQKVKLRALSIAISNSFMDGIHYLVQHNTFNQKEFQNAFSYGVGHASSLEACQYLVKEKYVSPDFIFTINYLQNDSTLFFQWLVDYDAKQKLSNHLDRTLVKNENKNTSNKFKV